uniref:Uncharacterized protein n=1 Tax=Aplanochytrium stocchinoi TaxID=215587 RepID=A0A7S3LM78_9STRA
MFGEALKVKYSTRNVKNMMQSFFVLFEALERHKITLSQLNRQHVMEDAYWNSIGEEDEDGGRRKSFIYYRESPVDSPPPKNNKPRKQRQSLRERRASIKTEYDQAYIESDLDDVQIDDETYRKSMRLLFETIGEDTLHNLSM